MQTSCATLALFSFVGGATAAETVATSNPLGQAVSLCQDLAAKIKKDGELEAKAYSDYFEWCDDVSKEKDFEIKTTTSQKDKLEATIEELGSAIETADTKVGELAEAISTADADLKSATAIRTTESADFAASEKELVDAVDTLGRAIGVLEREMQKGSAAFAQLSNSADLKTVVQSLSVVIDAASFTVSDKNKLLALVQSQQGSDDDESELGAPAASKYENQSGGILDVLADMKDKAENQLSELRKAEKTAQYNYELLKQSLEDQLSNDNKEMATEKSNKAAAEQSKASAEGELSVTVADLKDAETTLKSAQGDCMQIATDHDVAVRARAEELKVIAEAVKILEETTGGAVEQTYSLLQTEATLTTSSDLARSEVTVMLRKLARKHHSNALAQLASRISAVQRYGAGGGDPFVKIRGLIQDMIAKLEKQGSDAATEKAYCDEELAKSEAKKGELDAEIEKLTTSIDQAAAKSASLKEEVKVLQDELATMAKEQQYGTTVRQEQHAAYVEAKADLEKGLSGVRKALEVLRNYYAADSGSALLQSDAQFDALLQQPAAPAAHEKSGGAGGSIISILEVVESDLATNLAKVETAESDEQEHYETSTQEFKITTAGKDQDVKYKIAEFTGLDKTITELSSDRDTSGAELAAVMEYYGKLKARCIAKPEAYEERKKRREAEIEGLKEALSVLENEAALVQHSSRQGRRHMRGALRVD